MVASIFYLSGPCLLMARLTGFAGVARAGQAPDKAVDIRAGHPRRGHRQDYALLDTVQEP